MCFSVIILIEILLPHALSKSETMSNWLIAKQSKFFNKKTCNCHFMWQVLQVHEQNFECLIHTIEFLLSEFQDLETSCINFSSNISFKVLLWNFKETTITYQWIYSNICVTCGRYRECFLCTLLVLLHQLRKICWIKNTW